MSQQLNAKQIELIQKAHLIGATVPVEMLNKLA